jgi:hypothetical protein
LFHKKKKKPERKGKERKGKGKKNKVRTHTFNCAWHAVQIPSYI